MLKIAICDDEKYYRDRIENLLKAYLQEHNLNAELVLFQSGESFISQQENLVKYDIVFLDINMNEMDGIETAMRIRRFYSSTYIIFVTAFIDYALEGYKVNAVRYIMKNTLEISVRESMDAVLEKMIHLQVGFDFLQGRQNIYIDNLLYVESKKHKAVFYYMDVSITHYEIYDKLDHIEEELSEYGFFRIHKSYLVNLKHIRKVNNYEAVLDTGESLPIPRRRFQAAKEAFAAYKGAM